VDQVHVGFPRVFERGEKKTKNRKRKQKTVKLQLKGTDQGNEAPFDSKHVV